MTKSTGPRTARGKARASQNSAKHWIESGRILPDEEQEAAILRNAFMKDFNPEGSIEHEIIDDLTLNRLIRRRIDKAFTGEYYKASINQRIQSMEDYERSATQYWLRTAGAWTRNRAEREKAVRLRPGLCIAALEALVRGIGDRGPQPQDLTELRHIYADQPTEHAALAIHHLRLAVEKQAGQDETVEATAQKELKKSILEILQVEIEFQKMREELATGLYANYSASCVQETARPALETLLRYRAANTREFKDLLESLDRIRRLRQSAA
jgi:hypothetical protein